MDLLTGAVPSSDGLIDGSWSPVCKAAIAQEVQVKVGYACSQLSVPLQFSLICKMTWK